MNNERNDIQGSDTIVNVASVPQRSPFRYPGGKTWLVPKIRKWLADKAFKPALFIEPFAGGGIIGLTVAAEALSSHVIMVELDQLVAGVWMTIIQDEGGGEWLGNEIVQFELTPENLDLALRTPPTSVRDVAFKTILKNRVNRGGILASGAGHIKYGENGKGLLSRWYPETLRKRILDIVVIRDRITFVQGDGLRLIRENTQNIDSVFFIDPPYTASKKSAGSRLYTHSQINHDELFEITASCRGDFLMTYDNTEAVKFLAAMYGFDTELVSMKNTHHAEKRELLIGRNLDWLRD